MRARITSDRPDYVTVAEDDINGTRFETHYHILPSGYVHRLSPDGESLGQVCDGLSRYGNTLLERGVYSALERNPRAFLEFIRAERRRGLRRAAAAWRRRYR